MRPNPDRAARQAILDTIETLKPGDAWPVSRAVFNAAFETMVNFRNRAPGFTATRRNDQAGNMV